MDTATLNVLLTNLSFGSLFVALFVWTLRTSEKREEKYQAALVLLSERIVATLEKIIQTQDKAINLLASIERQTADHPHNRRKDDA